MPGMNQDEKAILEQLNEMLRQINEQLQDKALSLEEYNQLRAVARSIYLFAEDHKHLRPRDRTSIQPFSLLSQFNLQQDSGIKSVTLKTKIKTYLMQHPIVKKLSSAVKKIRNIITPARKKTNVTRKKSGTASLITAMPSSPGLSEALPPEMQLYILGKTDAKTRSTVGLVSTALYTMANDDSLWKADIQRTYDLMSADIDIIKHEDESYKQLFIRLREGMNTFMLYQSLDTPKPIDSFNEEIQLLLYADGLFQSQRAARDYSGTQSMRGLPVIVECKMPMEWVEAKVRDKDVNAIALRVKKINSREVVFDDATFKPRALHRSSDPSTFKR